MQGSSASACDSTANAKAVNHGGNRSAIRSRWFVLTLTHINVSNIKQSFIRQPSRKPLVIALAGALAVMASGASLAQSTEIVSGPSSTTFYPSNSYDSVRISATGHIATLDGSSAVYNGRHVLNFENLGTVASIFDGGVAFLNHYDPFGAINPVIDRLYNGGLIDGHTTGILNAGPGTIGTLQNAIQGTINGITAVQNFGAIGLMINDGTITASSIAIDNGGNSGFVPEATVGMLTNFGVIKGDVAAIRSSGTMGDLRNEMGASIESQGTAIRVEAGTVGRITNLGTISGGVYAIENRSPENNGIATITNQTPGTIIGTILNLGTIAGGTFGIRNEGKMEDIDNQGVLGGAAMGFINMAGGVAGNLHNSGGIGQGTVGSMSHLGMQNEGLMGDVVNSGIIVGNTTAIYNKGGSVLTNVAAVAATPAGQMGDIVNSGMILGQQTAIANSGTLGLISNSGTIIGGTTAIDNQATASALRIHNEGFIAGNILNATSLAVTISGGESTFGTIGGLYGIGEITSPGSDVRFTKGKLELNSNVDVGSHTVYNSGATLQLNGDRTIRGNYVQGADATLKLGVSEPTHYASALHGALDPATTFSGKLIVTGTARIDAGSSINVEKFNTYTFAPGQRFVVVDTTTAGSALNHDALQYSVTGYDGTVKGTETIVGDRTYLVVSLGDREVLIPVDPTTPTQPQTSPVKPTEPNAISSLAGLGRYTGVDNAQLLNLFNAGQALNNGTVQEANSAGKQLSPVSQTSSMRAAVAPTYDALKVIASRTDATRLARASDISGSGIATGERAYQWAGWGQAFGGHASQSDRGNYDGYRANYGGLLIGADRVLNDAWSVGGAFSYANTSLDATGDTSGNRTRINAYGLIGYAGYNAKTWYANLSAGAMLQRYDTTRHVDFTGFSGTTNGEFNGQQYIARLEAGYPLAVGRFTVTPLGSLVYSYLRQSAYSETGGNGAALNVGAANTTSVRSLVGAKLERGFQTASGLITPFVQLQWSHEYNRSRQSLASGFSADPSGSTLFTTVGPRPVGDLAVFNLGATLLKGNNMTLTARYGLEAAGGFMSHTGSVQVRRLF